MPVEHADIHDDRWAQLAGQFSPSEILDARVPTGWHHAICLVARPTR